MLVLYSSAYLAVIHTFQVSYNSFVENIDIETLRKYTD